jgi:S-adenosylmethionine:tRNA ribosyltransferase-isomerase
VTPDDFDYDLPEDLIAQEPTPERSASRLLCLGPDGSTADLAFAELCGLLHSGDVLVVNDTRVIPARLAGRKRSGGQIEMLLERPLTLDEALAQIRASHPPAAGSWLDFEGGATAQVLGRQGPFYRLRFEEPVVALLERLGHVPLPPYIRRADLPADRERYQTVFAREAGAVAAPTAGLHFDGSLLQRLEAAGVGLARLTLHVGAGTFAPLREEQLASGRLHRERVIVSAAAIDRIVRARSAGGRVVAVGTTVVRALETAAATGELAPFEGETELFIRPGHRFRAVDALVTNFHLPRSSLLMLVCAFGGRDAVLRAYRHAVASRYRFFSYGDAMFLVRNDPT